MNRFMYLPSKPFGIARLHKARQQFGLFDLEGILRLLTLGILETAYYGSGNGMSDIKSRSQR